MLVLGFQSGEPSFDRVDEFGGAQHADFHGVDDRVVADRVKLGDQEIGFHVHDAGHALRVLGEDAGHGGVSEYALRAEGFHVGHGAGAADRVGAFDGQDPQA